MVILITIWQEIHTLTDVLDFQNAAGWKLEYVYLQSWNVSGFNEDTWEHATEDAPEIVICCLESLS